MPGDVTSPKQVSTKRGVKPHPIRVGGGGDRDDIHVSGSPDGPLQGLMYSLDQLVSVCTVRTYYPPFFFFFFPSVLPFFFLLPKVLIRCTTQASVFYYLKTGDARAAMESKQDHYARLKCPDGGPLNYSR